MSEHSSRPQRSRLSSRLRAASQGFLIAALSMWALPALADHGSWTDHDLHYFEEGPSNYGSYADINASDQYDFGNAEWQRKTSDGSTLLEWESIICEGPNEGCTYRKTVTQYFPQSPYQIKSLACANDGAHKLSGGAAFYQICNSKGLNTHIHVINLS